MRDSAVLHIVQSVANTNHGAQSTVVHPMAIRYSIIVHPLTTMIKIVLVIDIDIERLISEHKCNIATF